MAQLIIASESGSIDDYVKQLVEGLQPGESDSMNVSGKMWKKLIDIARSHQEISSALLGMYECFADDCEDLRAVQECVKVLEKAAKKN